MQLLLTYFNQKTGPLVLESINAGPTQRQREVLEKLLDLSVDEEGFFEHANQMGEYFSSANYIFQINSEWARGNAETLMLTLITDEGQEPSIFKENLADCANSFKNMPRIYKGLYLRSKKNEAVKKQHDKIMKLLQTCHKQCKKNPQAQKPGKLLILGLKAVGKTSIIYRVTKNSFNPNVKPTLGMQIIKSAIDNFQFRIFDVGGQKRLRKHWFKPPPPDALIYVLDCTADSSQQEEAKKEFERVYIHYFEEKKHKLDKDTPVLILINKIDLCDKKFKKSHAEKLLKLKKKRINYKIGRVSALKNTGLEENFKWLVRKFLFE